MAKFELSKSEFALVPKGEVILKVVKVQLVPPKKPTKVVIDMVDKEGAKLIAKYNLAIKGARYYLTCLLKIAGGVTEDLDTSEFAGKLEGKFFKANVIHKVVDKVKDGEKVEGEVVTFPNIDKYLESVKDFERNESDLDALPEDDDLDLDDLYLPDDNDGFVAIDNFDDDLDLPD